MACFLPFFLTPVARVIVATAGNHSGTAAIAKKVPLDYSPKSNPRKWPIAIYKPVIAKTAMTSVFHAVLFYFQEVLGVELIIGYGIRFWDSDAF